MKPQAEISDRHILLAMKKYGGSFVMRLGDAGLYADTENLKTLKAAFPVLWEWYSRLAKQDLIADAEQKLWEANFKDTRSWPLGASSSHPLYNPDEPLIKPPHEHPIFTHCNVCGCVLRGDSEFAMGACTACANEGVEL